MKRLITILSTALYITAAYGESFDVDGYGFKIISNSIHIYGKHRRFTTQPCRSKCGFNACMTCTDNGNIKFTCKITQNLSLQNLLYMISSQTQLTTIHFFTTKNKLPNIKNHNYTLKIIFLHRILKIHHAPQLRLLSLL